MNFNKTLLRLKNNYLNLPKLSTYKYVRLNSVVCMQDIAVKHYRIPSSQVSLFFYSSVANEEQMKTKHLNPAITVPTLHFEDMPFEQPVTHDNLCAALQICDSIDDQMLALTSALALSPDDVQLRVNFCKIIESLLRPFFGEIKIQMFGSSVNGFGFKGCDVDMSFETFGQPKEEVSYLETPDVPLVSEVMSGKVSPLEISMLPPKEQLLFLHTVLLEFYKESEDPTIFINAHVPLVRFYHDKYGLKCDLTCRNRVAFSNTKLLYLLGRLDDRVIPLMMTIRYWAKHVDIIGKGLMFNTYTISLMVIHFLQTTNPPVLPSAQHILSLSDSLKIEDMSDNSFLAIKKFIPPSENTQTLSELLRDFFFYYLYFDFTRVICPLIGGSVPREEFFTKSTSKKFRMNSICVQDPMLESHNVAELVDYKTCKVFFAELITGCKLFQNSSLLMPSSSKWGLLQLFDKSKESFQKSQSGMTNLSFNVPFITRQIFDDCVKDNIELSSAQTFVQLLKHVLLFECKNLEITEVMKLLKKHDETIERQKKFFEDLNQRNSDLIEHFQMQKRKIKVPKFNMQKYYDALMVDDFQKANLKNKLILCAECKIIQNSWLGRCHISLESLPKNIADNIIEKERYISIHAAKQNAANAMPDKMKPFTFFLECYVSTELPESKLFINFRPFQKTSFNPILGIFLKEYIPKLMKYLNEDC